MKSFWDNLFYDMKECGLTEELFAVKAGAEIRDDLRRIEDAIKDHNGKEALIIIAELKNNY